jgi:endonuclease/exonuclease/phosphatase family metal-dependent hydrolase
MELTIGTWNIEGRLSCITKKGRGSPEHILREIKRLDKDILVLPEAYLNTIADGVNDALSGMGYLWVDTAYKETDRKEDYDRWGMPHMRVLSRKDISNVEYVRWGGIRTSLVCIVKDTTSRKDLRIIATHLDDRSENDRQKQIKDLVPYILRRPMPTIILGDFNAMWPGQRASLLNSKAVRFVAHHIPGKKLRYVLIRLVDMAAGTVLPALTSAVDTYDVDPSHSYTVTPKQRDILWMPSIPLAQIDHILITKDIKASNFTIGRDGGSDHRSISVNISL